MIRRKIQSLSFVKQGALNGFLLGTLIQLIFIRQIYNEINYYLFPDPPCYGNCPNMARMVDYSGLFYISLALSLIVALSCFVVHKLFANKIKSQIFIWALVAFFSTVFFYFYGSFHSFIKEYIRECWWVTYESCKNVSLLLHLQMNWTGLVLLPIIFGIFLAFNLLFIFVLNRKKTLLP
jgi:hypothetical protein